MIGVVRQDVKRSAGSSEFIGNSSFDAQAASCIQCLHEMLEAAVWFLPFTAWKIKPIYNKWHIKYNVSTSVDHNNMTGEIKTSWQS